MNKKERAYKKIWDMAFPGERMDELEELIGPGYDHIAYRNWKEIPTDIKEIIMGNMEE